MTERTEEKDMANGGVPTEAPVDRDGAGSGAEASVPAGQQDSGTAAPQDSGPAGTAGQERPVPDLAVKVAELTADLQRLQAEYVNYKRRVDRDRELVLQNAKFAVLSALLPVLDAIDRAREHEELSGGFKAVAESLERVVAGEGLVKYGAPGDAFDPRLHEALMHSLSAEVTTTTCDKVVQAGYQIGDRVVRPALVAVVDPDPSAAQPAEGRAEDNVEALTESVRSDGSAGDPTQQ